MMSRLPVIPDELLAALARDQPTTEEQTTTTTATTTTTTELMENKNKETIWNRIGFSSTAQQQQQQQQLTIKPTTNITKKTSTKQTQPRQRRTKINEQTNHPYQQQQPTTPTTTSSASTRARASFSFDHYIQTHLSPKSTTTTTPSSSSSTNTDPNKPRSRFIGSEIINGIFSNNNNSTTKSSPHLPPQQPLEKLEQPATRTSSINASKHFNISRASVDQIFHTHGPSSSSISTSTTSTSTPSSRRTNNNNQPHSRPAKPLRQPSLDESSLSSSSRPNLPPTTISSDRWSSTAVSVTLEDEIAEDDLLIMENEPPWSNRETFTHELRANRPEEDNLLIPQEHNTPSTPEDPDSTGTTNLTTTTTTQSTLVAAGSPQQNLLGNISRIPLPSKPSIIHHQPIPSTHFVVGDDGPTSLSARHVSIPASSSSHPDRSRSRSQSVINFSSHHLVRQHTGSGGLRQQIEARRALLASSSPSFQNPPNPGPDLPPPPPSSFHPLPVQPAAQTVAAAHTAPISLLSTTDNKLSSSSSSSSSSHGRSLSDTFIRKTRSLIAHPHHQHHLDHSFQHHHASLHSSSPSPLQSANLGKEIPAHLAKEMVLKDLGLESTAHQHLDPRILDHAQLLKLFQSTAQPSSSVTGIPLPSSETSDRPSASLEEELEEEEAELQLIDTPETREALNVKADFVIAVAGPKGVGKSTIISKALRKPVDEQHAVVLYHDPSDNRITSMVSSIVNQATGNKKVLQILEIDQSILNENCIISSNKNSKNKSIKKSSAGKEEGLVWPANLPHLDGVLLCYDATDPLALDHLRPLLHSFWTRGGISLIVLACKSDKEELKNATNPLKAAELVNVYGTGMIQLDGGLEDPGKKMRNSFNWIVKAIKEARGERRSYSSASSTNILGSIYGDEERRGSTSSSSIVASPSPMTTMGMMTLGGGVGGAVTEGQQISAMSGGSTASDEEELHQPVDPASVILSPSGKTAVPSPGRTPRKALPHAPLAAVTPSAKIPSTLAPARLFISSSSPVLPLDPSLHLDDADGDSFSNNALVAMSYEKSTRPDGSFMHGGSTPGSPREDRKPNGELPDPPSEPTPSSPPNNPGLADRAHTSSLLNPASLSSEPSIHSKNAPSEDLSRVVDPVKGLSGSGKHAVQKAIAMSQRGVDMDLHFEKQVIIDKFVFATVSGNEPSFVDQFLIIFRRFATPFEVLSALISRFEFVSTHIERDPILGRYAHLKICHVLMSWLEIYPGDFVQPATLTVLKAFNSLMVSVTWLLHYAIEIMPMIKTIGSMADEDVGWALPDSTEDSAVKGVLESIKKLQMSLAPMGSSSSAESRGSVAAESNDEPALPMTPLTTGKSVDYPHSELSPRLENFPSTSFMSTDHVASTAASSPVHSFSPHDRHHLLLKSNEDPQKPGDLLLLQQQQQQQQQQHLHHPLSALDSTENFIAATLPLKSTLTSSSLHSDHKAELKSLLDSSVILLSLPEESIALQITRLEWNIFSKMKPRHLIRYVLAPRDPNNPRKALRDPNSPIAKSTDYLNYLAVWASSMILIHEKLKSRARVLLKLMKVAYELRDMDDFHSLMGVLAGIEAQPVYRLDATFEIVQHMDLQSYRRYLSLKKLMSSQRSFSAYRLARQTASSQCVPYLGTYLQDITAVNEVKDDMKDGKVNLTKMIQIAKSASSVINCNLLAPKIVFDPKISNLIIKIPVLSEDAQYELSYKYKPRLQSSSHHSSHQAGSSSIHAGGSSGGGIMSVLAAAAATAGTTSNGSHSEPTNPKGGSGPLTTSVSSGSLIPGSTSSNNLFSTSSSPSACSANHLGSSTVPLNPTSTTTSSSIISTTTTGHPNHHHGASSSSAIHSVANVGAATSLVAKKGTRKLKQLLSTAINPNHHPHPSPSNLNLPQQHHQPIH
ncbi:hypothetical protein PGT21_019193 [Puccinia graminis f. sp. tritici]|uniref:Uncharacterized protein n=1 Tax=Puccinia graminis f. sp. tritici TaxID=56615 RepID=A0A5B0RKI2_PUCGR|nr:hypothetical protein PGT21_019193 [Puccinia graminis f. sp. tritici]KAA1125535.1 hypothetical protein PGTUg99_016145 [Puccinia graminis f. sp. tritici]